MTQPRSSIDRIVPYVPGKSIEEVAKEYGLTRVVKLASNENPLGPSPKALDAVRQEAADVFRYPDGASGELVGLLAQKLDVPQDHLIVGNGSDEVIKLLAEAYLEPGDQVIFADPSFSEYAYAARLMGAEEVAIPLTPDWVHDLDAMRKAVTPRTKLLFVCNPNNPTGTAVSHGDLQKLLDALPASVILVCDEAYVEYTDTPDFPSSVAWVKQGRNVVVLRTFSKVYGLAGLRVGYGIAPPHIMGNIWRVKEPFNVNRLAQAAACAALADQEHVRTSVDHNAAERNRVGQRLVELGCVVTASQTNFLWVDLRRPARPIFDALLRRGIIVRGGDAFGAPHHIRITMGTTEENDLFLENLTTIVSQ